MRLNICQAATYTHASMMYRQAIKLQPAMCMPVADSPLNMFMKACKAEPARSSGRIMGSMICMDSRATKVLANEYLGHRALPTTYSD